MRSMPLRIKQQQGAALVVGLLILLLATFMAVASLSNSTMQERMAGNEQNLNIAFQAAESAVNDQVNKVVNGNIDNFNSALAQYNVAAPSWPTDSYDMGNPKVVTTVEIQSKGRGSSTGQSLDADEGTTTLTSQYFEISAVSQITGSGARVNVVQGLEYR